MQSSHADRNLLVGILALQLDFVSRDQLITAMNAWVIDKSKTLGEIFVAQGALAASDCSVLDTLVSKHVEMHQGDPKQSLMALRIPGAVQRDLEAFTDKDIHASIARFKSGSSSLAYQTTLPLPQEGGAGGRYEVLRPHAYGGLGEVCVARDRELNREVALKRILDRHSADSASCSRFLMEAEITGGLEHPGIVPVYGLGSSEDGRPYYAMRFIRGETLKDAISRHHADDQRSESERRIELRHLLGRFIAVCNAIEYAHSRGVIHRDLKPSNIMLGKFGETLVVDWGLAKAVGRSGNDLARDESTLSPSSASGSSETLPGSAIGTPSYMSPEQAEGRVEEVGPASDVYSLGATLYMLLVGKAPFEASAVGLVIAKVQTGDFTPPKTRKPSVPGALSAICMKAMSLQPADRYSSCSSMASDIEHWLADEPVDAYAEPMTTRVARWVKRHRALASGAAVLGAALFVGLVAGAAFLGWSNAEIAEHAAETEQQRDEATRQQLIADVARVEATHERDLATRQLYVSQMNQAQRAWDDRLAGRARELLDSQLPEHTGGVDLRGWEWRYLSRLAHSELISQKTWALCLKYTPDGQSLVAGDYDGTLNIWSADGTRLLRSIKAHEKRISRLAITHDGQLLATASADGTVKLWETATLRLVQTLPAPQGLRCGLALSDDGRRVAISSSQFGAITLWSIPPRPATSAPDVEQADVKSASASSKVPTLTLQGHTGFVLSVVYTPDGKHLISGSSDGTVRKWDTGTGREVFQFNGGVGYVHVIAISSDGRRLATGGGSGNVMISDVESGRDLRYINAHAPRGVTGLAFSSDGRRVASCGNDTLVNIWSADNGQQITSLRGHASNLIDVCFSPDGSIIASSGWDEALRLWDTASYQEPWSLRLPTGVTCAAFSHDGELLVAGDGSETAAWKATSGESVWNQPERLTSYVNGSANALCVTPDDRRLVSALQDGRVNVRETQTGRLVATISAHTGTVYCVAVSPDGNRFATGGADGQVGVWNLADGKKVTLWKAHATPVLSVAFSPDGRLLASAGAEEDQHVNFWDTANFQKVRTLVGHEGSVFCTVFSPDGKLLFTGSKDEKIRWWDVATGKMLRESRAHSGNVLSLAVSRDGQRLASASDDHTIQIRDVATGQELLTLKPDAGPCFSVEFSPDSLMLATSTQNKGVLVWDARALTNELRAELRAGRDDVIAARNLVESLFDTHLLQGTVISKLNSDREISESVRTKALAIAIQRASDPQQLNERSWMVVRAPGQSPEKYAEALVWAEAACKAFPGNPAMFNTLGVACYRAEKYIEAEEVLTKSDAQNSKSEIGPVPADITFLAMARFRLGRTEAARALLDRVRQLLATDRWKSDAESIAFLNEAEKLIGDTSRKPVEAVRPMLK